MAEAVQTAIVDLAVKKLVNKGYGAINYVMDLESELKRLEYTRTLIEAALLDADSMSEQYSHTEQDTLEKLSCQLDRNIPLDPSDWSEETMMHNVMYELVLSIAGFKYKVADSNTYNIDERVRHLSFWKTMESSYREIPSLSIPKHLQSFIIGISMIPFPSDLKVRNLSVIGKFISTFECLKVLDLHAIKITKLPASVGELICLRYLNLSQTEIVKLPNSITHLVNLQSLYLINCYLLEELPRGMSKLVNLRHLKLKYCARLRHMPMGLGSLTNLTTLDVFIVGEQTESEARLSDLNQLNNLRGEIHIAMRRESKYIKSSEVSAVNLKMKEKLLQLSIAFRTTKEDERVLEGLQPPCNLKILEIRNYGGERLPSWMINHQLERYLPKLVKIDISLCKTCKYMCPLGRLPHLKILHLFHLDEVEYMEDNTTTSNESATNIVEELTLNSLFPSLETFVITVVPKLKGWWRMQSSNEQYSRGDLQVQQQQHQHLVKWMPPFPKLYFLDVDSVELLIALTRQHFGGFTSLKVLYINSHGFKQPRQQQKTLTLQNKNFFFPNLRKLILQGLDEFGILPESFRGLSSLKDLCIDDCKNHKAIPEWIDALTSLNTLRLENCPRLESLPHQIANLPNLKTLEIDKCPILWERCQSPNGEYWRYIQHIPNLNIKS